MKPFLWAPSGATHRAIVDRLRRQRQTAERLRPQPLRRRRMMLSAKPDASQLAAAGGQK